MILSILLFIVSPVSGLQMCSRVALIKYQEILVDTNSSQKGEGLRYYLEKSPKAKYYLDTYQSQGQTKWQSAALGTVGTGLLLAGVFKPGDESYASKKEKRGLVMAGAFIIAMNFFVVSMLSEHNEKNLQKAIEEYNKNNLPRIDFDPLSMHHKGSSPSSFPMVYVKKTWWF